MKKIFSAILIVLTVIALTGSAFAIFNNFTVADKAGYLTENQLAELSKQLDDVRQKYNFDVAVYTEEVMSGADAMSTADDLYDYTLYGYGENSDGIMLYIAADERVYHFTVHGSGETIFNDNGLFYLESKILPSLQEDDYYTAMKLYGEHCEELLQMAEQGTPYNEKQLSTGYVAGVVGCALLIPHSSSCGIFHDKEENETNENRGRKQLCRGLHEAGQYEFVNVERYIYVQHDDED